MTFARALGDVLRRDGVRVLVGDGLAGLRVARTGPDEAAAVAEAHRRVEGCRVALVRGRTLEIDRSGEFDVDLRIRDADDLLALDDALARATGPWCTGAAVARVELDVDLSAPCDAPGPSADPVDTDRVLARIEGADAIGVLVGVGATTSDVIGGLHGLAARLGARVLNTYGAKGTFRWDNPHHAATIGLQRRDLELADLADGRPVLVAGLDASTGLRDLAGVNAVVVDPRAFEALMAAAPQRPLAPVPPVRERLAAPIQAAWARAGELSEPIALLHLIEASRHGVLVADAGPGTFWAGRVAPTPRLGSVLLPAKPQDGIVGALAIVALQRRGASRVVVLRSATGPWSALDDELLGRASAEGCAVTIDEWVEDGPVTSVDAHRQALAAPRATTRIERSILDELVAVAGEADHLAR